MTFVDSNNHHVGSWLNDSNPLLMPDVLQPSQFADTKRNPERSPEHRLWLAFLERAIADIQYGPGNKDSTRLRHYKDRLWLEDDYDGVGSFVYVCHVLGFDVERTRKAIGTGRGIKVYRRAVEAGHVKPAPPRDRALEAKEARIQRLFD